MINYKVIDGESVYLLPDGKIIYLKDLIAQFEHIKNKAILKPDWQPETQTIIRELEVQHKPPISKGHRPSTTTSKPHYNYSQSKRDTYLKNLEIYMKNNQNKKSPDYITPAQHAYLLKYAYVNGDAETVDLKKNKNFIDSRYGHLNY